MTYVVLLPKAPGNTTDKHLIVDAVEYVDVTRHGKTTYDFVSEHDDYDSASTERDRLNRKPDAWTPLTTSTPSPAIATTETTSAPGKPEEATPTAPPEYCDLEAEPGEEHCTRHMKAAADLEQWETEHELDEE